MYTFLGLLCFKIKSNSIEISRGFALFNVIQQPIALLAQIYIHVVSSSERLLIFENDLLNLKSVSSFTKALYRTALFSVVTSTLLISQHQFWNRNRVLRLMIDACGCELSEKYSRKFAKKAKMHFIILSVVFIAIWLIQILGLLKHSLAGFAMGFALGWPYLFQSEFLSFLRTFEFFFITQLEDFKNELGVVIENFVVDGRSYLKLAKKYQKIVDFNEKFNETIGLQITMVTCCQTFVTTLAVSISHFGSVIAVNSWSRVEHLRSF